MTIGLVTLVLHGLLDSIVIDKGFLFTSKFWSSLCYFLGIKQTLFTTFYPQTDSQSERQNSTMKRYLQAFVNFEQNNWAKLLPMAKFAYNNAKNSSTGHTPFEVNCGYHPCVSFETDTVPYSRSKSVDKLSAELQNLMTVCQENLHHTQELQKQAHNKSVKPKSYAPGNNVWLNKKYIKIKCNRKLKIKFFRPFQVLHLVGKQAYKLKLSKWWKIYNVFHVSVPEQDTTRKKRVNKRVTELEVGNSKEYKIKAIWDTTIYASKSESG